MIYMSRAFIKEGDAEWLDEVPPTVNALSAFLSRENNGIRIFEHKQYTDEQGREIHVMSNGMSYTRDENRKWKVIL